MGLFDLFSNANEEKAAQLKTQGLTQGYDLASGLFGQGRDAVNSYYGQAAQPFQQLFGQAGQGAAAYGDASGANGAEGLGRATSLFQQTPGYAAGLSTGLDALDRRAASRGMLNSGNNTQDTLKFANDYASQKYGQYLQGLQPYLGQQTTAAGGLAGVLTGQGGALNSSYGNQGLLGFQKETGIGNAQAAAELSKDNVGANVLGALGLGVKLFGFGK